MIARCRGRFSTRVKNFIIRAPDAENLEVRGLREVRGSCGTTGGDRVKVRTPPSRHRQRGSNCVTYVCHRGHKIVRQFYWLTSSNNRVKDMEND